jgi:predicted RNA binding protein YcfA (HicA-like mRNA interferase family)
LNWRFREQAVPGLHRPRNHEGAAKHGFVLAGRRGSHQKWRHVNGRQVIVADHGSKPIPIGTPKSIIEGSGLDLELFR